MLVSDLVCDFFDGQVTGFQPFTREFQTRLTNVVPQTYADFTLEKRIQARSAHADRLCQSGSIQLRIAAQILPDFLYPWITGAGRPLPIVVASLTSGVGN